MICFKEKPNGEIAVQHEHTDIVSLLLVHGANPNIEGTSKPLWDAARRGRTEIAKLLLDHGANPDLLAPVGCTPLFAAVQCKHTAMVRLLLERNADYAIDLKQTIQKLHIVAKDFGVEEQMALFIRSKLPDAATISDATIITITPIEIAGIVGHSQAVELIEKAIAASQQRNSHGFFPTVAAVPLSGTDKTPDETITTTLNS